MTDEPAIRVRGLRKTYGAQVAVESLDLDVARGECFALLGPNGAGKTTTVEILEGYRPRSGGEVSVLGVDPAKPNRDWRARMGIVLQGTGEFETVTVREIVSHFARYYPAPRDPEEVIAAVGLTGKATARAAALSGGQRRRLDIALGIVGRPKLLFLDEPTTGLDPEARRTTWDLVRDLQADGTAVLLTTHYIEEAHLLADRVAVMSAGRIVALDTPAGILARTGLSSVATIDVPAAHGTPPGATRDGRIARLKLTDTGRQIRALLQW